MDDEDLPVFVRLREDAAGCLVLPEKAGAAIEGDLVLPVGGRIDGVLGLLERGTERMEGAADFTLLAGWRIEGALEPLGRSDRELDGAR